MDNDKNGNESEYLTSDYLQELFKDKKLIQSSGVTLKHGNVLLDKEISRAKEYLFKFKEPLAIGDTMPEGKVISRQEKIFLPVKENPNYNFVGRILGPRGYTAKQLEQKLDCKIMIRGQGSMRDHSKEEQNRGKPNWEHLNQELHVLLSFTDYENRIDQKIIQAKEAINKFIEEGLNTPESQDTLKQMQLMELSILNENDRIQQQQRQQLYLQQSTALQINPNILNQNIIKFPILPMSLTENNHDLSHLLSNTDPLQLLSLNQPWTIFNNSMIQQDNIFTGDPLLPLNGDQTTSLMTFINNSNNLPYMNYNISAAVKQKTDQRTHPYSRAT